MAGKSSIGFSGSEKLTFLVEIPKISKFIEKLQVHRGRRSCSTSYPSGNQVDGSPLVAMGFELTDQLARVIICARK